MSYVQPRGLAMQQAGSTWRGRSAIVALAALIVLSLAPVMSTRALPLVTVHLPPVTQHSIQGVQSEIADARTKLQRDRDRKRSKPARMADGQH